MANNNTSVTTMAYDLAAILRKRYLDKGFVVPASARYGVLKYLQREFDLTLEQAKAALAQGFFKSR